MVSTSFDSRVTSSAALRYCGSSAQFRSMGCPYSLKPPVRVQMRAAKVFMAPRVVSYESRWEGNDQTFARGIWPKPFAFLPPNELTAQDTFKTVIWELTIPPNLMGTRYL